MLLNGLPNLWNALERGRSVLIHCAAGIHRTGMVAYGLLRWCGHSADEALTLIGQMRTHTRDGLQPKQLQWGDEISHLEL
jgi:protein-tyrosine phosphatase